MDFQDLGKGRLGFRIRVSFTRIRIRPSRKTGSGSDIREKTGSGSDPRIRSGSGSDPT